MRRPSLTAALMAVAIAFPISALAQAPVALTGVVSSSEEAVMEGVLVSATKAGSNVTLTWLPVRMAASHFRQTALPPDNTV